MLLNASLSWDNTLIDQIIIISMLILNDISLSAFWLSPDQDAIFYIHIVHIKHVMFFRNFTVVLSFFQDLFL